MAKINSGMSFGDIAKVSRNLSKIELKSTKEKTLTLIAILADRCEELKAQCNTMEQRNAKSP